MKFYLVIDDVWYTIHLGMPYGRDLHRAVLELYGTIERDNLEEVSIDPRANWRLISVMLVDKETLDVRLRYFGTHMQILREMEDRADPLTRSV